MVAFLLLFAIRLSCRYWQKEEVVGKLQRVLVNGREYQ